MTQAARAPHSADGAPARRPRWIGALVAGLAFGVAYGVTQRLVNLNFGELIRFGQGFDVQVFPGTSLESLRLRFGAAEAELRGDLELQQLERQKTEPALKPAPAQPDAAGPDPGPDPALPDTGADTGADAEAGPPPAEPQEPPPPLAAPAPPPALPRP
ncbi:MAG: hypothetical protein ACKO0M_12695 [Cyanobium sp.]